jgi:hypothetical protein
MSSQAIVSTSTAANFQHAVSMGDLLILVQRISASYSSVTQDHDVSHKPREKARYSFIQGYLTIIPPARAPPHAAYLPRLMRADAAPVNVATATTLLLLADGDGVSILSVTSPVLLVDKRVPALALFTRTVDEVDVAVLLEGVVGVFVPVSVVNPLAEAPDAAGSVDTVGTPSTETVPERSMVEAAFTSALAVRGKPKTWQMFAMAPNVAAGDEHAFFAIITTC